MRQLSYADLRVGEPLPFSVYDGNGRLLLRKGVVIAFEQQIERLIANGLYADAGGAPDRPASPAKEKLPPVFDEIGSLTLRLKTTFTDFFGAVPADDIGERVVALARGIHVACARDAEAAIAAIHLDSYNSYPLAHHVHSAVLCSLMGRRMGLPDGDLMPVLCAALTYDMGLVDMIHLEKQLEPLSTEQCEVVRRHPARGVELLKRAGIDDEIWLAAISNHHERVDGSGYPKGLSGDDVPLGARMLGVADSYTAMTKGRPYRDAKVPAKAVGEIFGGKDNLFGARVSEALVKELGMYPPGAIVRLANGETAVVKARGARITQPQVFSVYDASGMPFMLPQQRDSRLDEYAVKAPVAHSECRAVVLIMRRLWAK